MSPISEALAMIAQYRDQHGVDPEVMYVSFHQWQALKADFEASLAIAASPGGIDRIGNVKIEVQPEPPTFKSPGLFKRPVNLEQYRNLKPVEMLTGKRLPYEQYGVVAIDTAQELKNE